MAVNYNDINKLKNACIFLPADYVEVVNKIVEHLTPTLTEGFCPECKNDVVEYEKFCCQCGKALVTKDI